MSAGHRYKAFISYSRSDSDFARDLHRRLENYVLPIATRKDIDGSERPRRPVRPVFRDEGELVPGGSLPQRLQEAVNNSETLVLVCSPDAARREWVDVEVRYFLEAHSLNNLLCIVTDGEPRSSEAGDDRNECFPPALLELVKDTGDELLWIDARSSRRISHANLLRTVAAITGLRSVDELFRRDEARRRRRVLSTVAASLLVIVAFTGTVWLSRRDAALKDADNLERLAEAAGNLGDHGRAGRFLLKSIALRDAYFSQAITPLSEALMRRTLAMNRLRFSHRGRSVEPMSWAWKGGGTEIEISDAGKIFRYQIGQDRITWRPNAEKDEQGWDSTVEDETISSRDHVADLQGDQEKGYEISVTRKADGARVFHTRFPIKGEIPRLVGQPSSDEPSPQFSTDGKSIAMCGIKDCFSWSIGNLEPTMVFHRETMDDTIPRISPSGALIAMPEGSRVRVVDFRTSTTLFEVNVGDIGDFDFSPDERYLVTSDRLGDVRLWEVQTLPASIALYDGVTLDGAHPPSVAISNDGMAFYGLGGDRPQAFRSATFSGPVRMTSLAGDESEAISATASPNLVLVSRGAQTDVAEIGRAGDLVVRQTYSEGLQASPRGDFLFLSSGSEPGAQTQVKDLEGKSIFDAQGGSQVWDISPDGKQALLSSGSTLSIIDTATKAQVWQARDVPDFTQAAIHWPSRGVALLNSESSRLIMLSDRMYPPVKLTWTSQVPSLTFSRSGNVVAVVNQELTHYPSAPTELWSMARGTSLGQIAAGPGEKNANGILLLPDGNFAISYNNDRTIVWDVATSIRIAELVTPPYLHDARLVEGRVTSFGGTGIALRQDLPPALSVPSSMLPALMCDSVLHRTQRTISQEDALISPTLRSAIGRSVCGAPSPNSQAS